MFTFTNNAGTQHENTFGPFMVEGAAPDTVPEEFQTLFDLGLKGPTAAVTVKVKKEKSQKSADQTAEVWKYGTNCNSKPVA